MLTSADLRSRILLMPLCCCRTSPQKRSLLLVANGMGPICIGAQDQDDLGLPSAVRTLL